jgi:hypothetical protein
MSVDWQSRAERAERELEQTKAELGLLRGVTLKLNAAHETLTRLSAAEEDAVKLTQALTDVRSRANASIWIGVSRGSYEWDDEKYQQETRLVLEEILAIVEKGLHFRSSRLNGQRDLFSEPSSTSRGT